MSRYHQCCLASLEDAFEVWYTMQGYVLDKKRLMNGQIFDEDYFEHLIAEIQEIRASERRSYQEITDIYATAVDYDKNSQLLTVITNMRTWRIKTWI